MSNPSDMTLGHRLFAHAQNRGAERAFTFLRDGDDEEGHLTYAELWRRAGIVAAHLRAAGLAGERAILLHPPGMEFIVAFCGCLLAGTTAVPLHPPVTRRLLDRARLVVQDCRAAAILTMSRNTVYAELAAAGKAALIATDTLTGDGLAAMGHVPPHELALLQYTSGSTGAPKGVMITHGNLLANSEQIGRAFGTQEGDIGVNWLPLLHDMGLIGSVVHVIDRGMHCVHLSPQAMIRRPLRWLKAIHKYRASISGGPDFAWRHLAERVEAKEVEDLDLSCWKVAYSGAESVRATTLDRVAVLLAHTRFPDDAFVPCYGLAEATLIVSGGPRRSDLHMERPIDDDDVPPYIGCGIALPAGSVAIIDPQEHHRLADGFSGEVWVSGAHVAAGYWGREAATIATFRARLAGDPCTWLRTGDLGFLRQGILYISGRIKDLLIVNGRKHHAEDIETTLQAHVERCAGGTTAVFQAERNDRGHLVAAVEMADPPTSPEDFERLRERINAAVWCFHEIMIDEIAMVRLGRLPRTTSGKIQRNEARTRWLEGTLGQILEEAV